MENWQLYKRLIGAHIRSQMQYRVSFVLDLITQFAGTIVDFAATAVLFVNFPTIGGWSLGEVAFLYGMSSVSFSLADMIATGYDYSVFGPNMVQRGGFDQILTRPVNAFVQVLASGFALRRLGRMAQGVAILLLSLVLIDVTFTPIKIVYLLIMLAAGVLFFMGLFIFGSGLSFWTVESLEAMNIVTYGGQFMASYPMHIYQEWIRSLFMFIIPMAFVNYYPSLWLLDKPDPLGGPVWLAFLAPFVCVAVFLIGVRMWWFGVRHYTSTGS